MDAGGDVYVLAEAGSTPCLLWFPTDAPARILARVNDPLALGGTRKTPVSLGSLEDWCPGPRGMIVGKLAASDGTEILVVFQDGLPFEILSTGSAVQLGVQSILPAVIMTSGGGSSEDGHGGFLNSNGRWVATLRESSGATHVVTGHNAADLDGDGRDNLLESALGSDPETAFLSRPLVTLHSTPAGQRSTRYLVPESGGAFGNLAHQIEISPNLEDWETLEDTASVSSDQSDVPSGYLRMEQQLPPTDPGFLRIRILSR